MASEKAQAEHDTTTTLILKITDTASSSDVNTLTMTDTAPSSDVNTDHEREPTGGLPQRIPVRTR